MPQLSCKSCIGLHGDYNAFNTGWSIEYHGATIDGATISMGISAFPDQGKTADELIAAADAAMYRAKREGRNRICLPE
jgi:diguanylate cyclase (GGDEF)-like protein